MPLNLFGSQEFIMIYQAIAEEKKNPNEVELDKMINTLPNDCSEEQYKQFILDEYKSQQTIES